MQPKQSELHAIIEQACPDHCQFLGNSIITRVIANIQSGKSPRDGLVSVAEGGLSMDYELVLKTTIVLLGVIQAALEMKTAQIIKDTKDLELKLKTRFQDDQETMQILKTQEGSQVIRAVAESNGLQ